MTSPDFTAKAVFNDAPVTGLSITCITEESFPPPTFQTHGQNPISSKIRLECAPKMMSHDILSPAVLCSLTINHSNVVYSSYTTTLQPDCIPSAPTARETRASRKTQATRTSTSLLHTLPVIAVSNIRTSLQTMAELYGTLTHRQTDRHTDTQTDRDRERERVLHTDHL